MEFLLKVAIPAREYKNLYNIYVMKRIKVQTNVWNIKKHIYFSFQVKIRTPLLMVYSAGMDDVLLWTLGFLICADRCDSLKG